MTLTQDILSSLPGNTYENLQRADAMWSALRQGTLATPEVLTESEGALGECEFDVAIAGGTLGIVMGAALARLGWRVAVLERGQLKGREQEWNISRHELQVLVALELLSEEELEMAISMEFNPVRLSFLGGEDVWVRDVLNIGVSPEILLEQLKARFLADGGELLEYAPVERVVVHPDGVEVLGGERRLTCKLLLDAMGHFSPIARQARKGQKPDAICVVVGTCAQGYTDNETGDLLVSFTPTEGAPLTGEKPAEGQCQYFWEAFPARDGRTTYMFSYLDAHPDRPSLEAFFEEYLRLLPDYQNVELNQLVWKRALFGFFPCYRNSPLGAPSDRVLPIGDSSSSQSPLSFGGFGAMLRHLSRLTAGIDEALKADALAQSDLDLLQPYQPNLAVTWLFQRSMSARVGQQLPPNRINDLLVAVFKGMEQAGDGVLKPFLQDVVQFPALAQALLRTTAIDPIITLKVLPQVGILALLEWTAHYAALGSYSLLNPLGRMLQPAIASLPPRAQYRWHQRLQAWKYGSGGDFEG
ncbi:MAG: FAD-binding oxidoreductase [Cyanobacteria bacterium J06597_1]